MTSRAKAGVKQSDKKQPKEKQAKANSLSPRSKLILREGALIAWLSVCVFLLVALSTYSETDPGWSHTGRSEQIDNAGGPAGAWLADVFFALFGFMAYLFPLLLGLRAWRVFRQHRHEPTQFDGVVFALRILGFVLVMISATSLVSLHYGHLPTILPMGWGGILGESVGNAAEAAFSYFGSTLILLAIFLFGLTVFTDISWLSLIDTLGKYALLVSDKVMALVAAWKARREDKQKGEEAQKRRLEVSEKQAKKDIVRKPPSIQQQPKKPAVSQRVVKEQQTTLFEEPLTGSLPPISLLDQADKESGKGYSRESLEAMSKQLELKLMDFGISVEVVEVLPGPVITRFEIQPAAGIKVSRITNLAKDLARSLAVVSVRVVEVIPGKSVVGIEIPNEHREMVRLSEVLSSDVYDHSKSPLTMALGHDISGIPIVADLAKMPHLLVAGTTGSGKSVGINAMLLSLLYKAGPDDVRMILVDPKMLELSIYEGIPHLLTPVVTDMKDAANALRWCVGEMERRYKLMSALGVRNLSGFNRKVLDAKKAGSPITDPLWIAEPDASLFEDTAEQAPELEKLPYIVVVIDEFADMMMIVGKKVEQLIARIAQKARAAGIHLVLATQRPSVDVITGLIKANIPTRIAFQVSSKVDSRTILDQGGAEQLLGHGDMLYLPPGHGVPMRVHGAFVADNEVHRVVSDWQRRGEPEYLEEILDQTATAGIPVPGFSSEGSESTDDESDPLYDEAVALVLESRKASISSVQRKLRIGYNRAARLIEQMEASGVVSEMGANGNREVLAPSHKD